MSVPVGAIPAGCGVVTCQGLLGGATGGAVGSLAGHAAVHAASHAALSTFDAFAAWVVTGAAWLIDRSIVLIKGSTKVDFTAGWFLHREAVMLRIALLLIVPMVLAATAGAVVRQDGRRLVRIYGVGVPVAVVSSVAVVALSRWAMVLVDAMCRLVTGTTSYKPYAHLDGNMTAHGMPVVVQLIIGAVVVAAALVLWLELVFRAVVIYIAVFFLPLGLAALVWPATSHVAKRFVEVVVAVIGSKFVVVATLTLGAAMVEHSGAGVDDAIQAAVVVLIAAFAPFSLLRLVPLVEVAAIAHLEGMSRRPIHAGSAVASTAAGGARSAMGLLSGGSGRGDASTDGVGPVGIASRAGDFAIGGTPSGGGSSDATAGAGPPAGVGLSGAGPSGAGPSGAGSPSGVGSSPAAGPSGVESSPRARSASEVGVGSSSAEPVSSGPRASGVPSSESTHSDAPPGRGGVASMAPSSAIAVSALAGASGQADAPSPAGGDVVVGPDLPDPADLAGSIPVLRRPLPPTGDGEPTDD